jgi:hypothetical protein
MLRDVTEGHRTLRKWFAVRRFRRRFRKTPAFTIAELPEDTVGRITGVAQPLDGAVLTGPISGRPCLYWAIEVIEMLGEDWQTRGLIDARRGIPFVLAQDGHRALVDPAAVITNLIFDHENKSSGLYGIDKLQKAVIDEFVPHRSWQYTELLVFREAIVEVGEKISVVGSGTREPDPDAAQAVGYREGTRTRLRLTGSTQHPLALTDDPRCM